ncbi:hypothetical protein EDD86DRAFT_245409 [Gorgonomyces haynaldii]|nr:hypothetical protein EDD86DRAFT_245409 [Gorgonomyces haynaldii]
MSSASVPPATTSNPPVTSPAPPPTTSSVRTTSSPAPVPVTTTTQAPPPAVTSTSLVVVTSTFVSPDGQTTEIVQVTTPTALTKTSSSIAPTNTTTSGDSQSTGLPKNVTIGLIVAAIVVVLAGVAIYAFRKFGLSPSSAFKKRIKKNDSLLDLQQPPKVVQVTTQPSGETLMQDYHAPATSGQYPQANYTMGSDYSDPNGYYQQAANGEYVDQQQPFYPPAEGYYDEQGRFYPAQDQQFQQPFYPEPTTQYQPQTEYYYPPQQRQ